MSYTTETTNILMAVILMAIILFAVWDERRMNKKEECGYCGTSTDSNDICQKCWFNMQNKGK